MKNKTYYPVLLLFTILCILPASVLADEKKEETIYDQRLALYKKTETITEIPWYFIAAVDQYERQIHKDIEEDQVISIRIPDEIWYGAGNNSTDINTIQLFQGIGKDGNGDHKADPTNGEDILYTMASYIKKYGYTEEDFKIALWNYYNRDLTVQTIKNTAKVFKKFNGIHLTDRDFPVATNYNYSYRNTWGDRRGFGGNRIHEGTDIFADYGTPVHSTTYGVVELKGWNLYGGWRIGIRDIFNIYHYYAHLSGYEEELKVGQIVKPGDVIGSVGSTGYGPPGTSGKFPPHLHYGMYKDNGYSEWSFDPYPYLRKWERMAKNK
ncbi:M23 family metallopeptidase [Ornithinibacillus massiliensis]|uniref:M23 family metallopeptidase n=1 Tax=Ornithinibacillus massiliensis TaxID=1944633 RepID=A0ABS5MII6_9BACI|nr:M23 family metallopeptidase [Ornithinibacillus massiliensis]MBS3682152.1 M23 family metallopeptidase [Ornithinibacillus massiliensis]